MFVSHHTRAVNPKHNSNDFAKSPLPPRGKPQGEFSAVDVPLYVDRAFYVESGHEQDLWSMVVGRPHVPAVVIGVAGTGKSTLVQYVLRTYSSHPSNEADNTIVSYFDALAARIEDVDLALFHKLQNDIRLACSQRGVEIDRHVNRTPAHASSLREWCDRALSVMPGDAVGLQLILALDGVDQLPTEVAQHLLHTGLSLNRRDAVRKVILPMRPYTF
jgi:hypothetical protein